MYALISAFQIAPSLPAEIHTSNLQKNTHNLYAVHWEFADSVQSKQCIFAPNLVERHLASLSSSPEIEDTVIRTDRANRFPPDNEDCVHIHGICCILSVILWGTTRAVPGACATDAGETCASSPRATHADDWASAFWWL